MTHYPSSDLLDNAQYWIGEAYYVTRDYEHAARAFRAVGERWPDSRKAPDALLKLGYTQTEQKHLTDARATLCAGGRALPGNRCGPAGAATPAEASGGGTLSSAERLKITEIFYSLQGEAQFVGVPTVFVRLTGCPLRCHYCDTAYAFHGGEWWNLPDILEHVAQYGTRDVCVTGRRAAGAAPLPDTAAVRCAIAAFGSRSRPAAR